MGAEIKMVSANRVYMGYRSRSAIKLSVGAGTNCLIAARTSLQEVGQLINTGIYHDKHIGEPSIASLIHRGINNLLPRPLRQSPFDPGCFCYDLSNGGCGFLNGIQVIDSFIMQNRYTAGLVIAGDAAPTRRERWYFPYAAAASALLLSHSDLACGFRKFYSKTFPQFLNDHSGQLTWMKRSPIKRFSHVLKIWSDSEYLTHCISSAEQALGDFFSLTKTAIETFDLIIPSVSPAGFGEGLGKHAGCIDRFILPDKNWGEVYTAGLGFGLQKAWQSGRFKLAKNILFVTVGGGITVSLAWYQKEAGK